MKKRIILLFTAFVCLTFSGCTSRYIAEKIMEEAEKAFSEDTEKFNPKEYFYENDGLVTADENGYAEGRIGTVFSTAFFEYSVDNVNYVSQYENYTANDGMQLIDATISIKNTYGEKLPMFNDDFQLQWHDLGDGDEDYCFGVIMDDSETVMPKEYTLATADSVTYHVVFEAPEEAEEFSIDFLEYFDNDTEGDIFFTYFEK